ncbi:MAG: ATP-binding protein [Desulfurococcales archaeon]|nr:ATP-binding protein [Desulfurococcales archaeon]
MVKYKNVLIPLTGTLASLTLISYALKPGFSPYFLITTMLIFTIIVLSNLSPFINSLGLRGLIKRKVEPSQLYIIKYTMPDSTIGSDTCVKSIVKTRSQTSRSRILDLTDYKNNISYLVVIDDTNNAKFEAEVLYTSILASCSNVRVLEKRPVLEKEEYISSIKDIVSEAGFAVNRTITSRTKIKRYVDLDPDISFDIELGKTLNTRNVIKVGLAYEELLNRVAVFGSTGSGKSTTLAKIISGLYNIKGKRKTGFLTMVLDWHGEYPQILGNLGVSDYIVIDPSQGELPINIFCYDIFEPENIAEVLSSVLSLSVPQTAFLTRIISSHKPLSFRDLYKLFQDYIPSEGYWDREIKFSIERRLSLISNKHNKILFEGKCSIGSLKEKLSTHRPIIIDLFKIKNGFVRRVYAFLLVAMMYQLKKNRLLRGDLIIFLDELQNLISFRNENYPILEELVVEGRKFGVSIVISTQNPSKLSADIIMNTGTKIIHSIRSGVDYQTIIGATKLPDDIASLLPTLDTGEAILVSPRYKNPLFIKVEL